MLYVDLLMYMALRRRQLVECVPCTTRKRCAELIEKCPNHGILIDGLLTENVRIDRNVSIRTFFVNNPSIAGCPDSDIFLLIRTLFSCSDDLDVIFMYMVTALQF